MTEEKEKKRGGKLTPGSTVTTDPAGTRPLNLKYLNNRSLSSGFGFPPTSCVSIPR